jgi:hypothetical protein
MSGPAGQPVTPMLRAALLKIIATQADTAAKAAAAECGSVFAGTGTSQARPRLPDGTEIATIFTTGGGPGQLSVTDREKFTAWVAAEHPDETELVVRKSFEDQLIREVRKRGAAVTRNGEPIPGLGPVAGRASGVTVKPRDDALENVTRAWREGALPPAGELLYPDTGTAPELTGPAEEEDSGAENRQAS